MIWRECQDDEQKELKDYSNRNTQSYGAPYEVFPEIEKC